MTIRAASTQVVSLNGAAAESNGHNAIHPGNAPCTSTRMPTDTMLTKPAHPRSTRSPRLGRRYGMARATRDPSANSHSRARVSKYANACWVCVVITENASETAKTAPKHTASTGTLLRPVRPAADTTDRITIEGAELGGGTATAAGSLVAPTTTAGEKELVATVVAKRERILDESRWA